MIVIDAGHGGDDPGAVGNGIIEKNLNLEISNYMANRFRELGESVVTTRTGDETIPPQERVQRVLSAFGSSPSVIVISNHINASGGDGAEVIYALRNTSTLPNLILEEIAKRGQNIRRAYQRRLPTDTSKDYYFMQRDTTPLQTITVEYGFLDSPYDDVEQLKNFSKDYAEAVVEAVMKYKKLPYTPPIGANVFVAQKGDSLWSIAKRLNVTVEELKAANNLASNLISIGQVLKIPIKEEIPLPGEYVVYTVVSGDSLYKIANKYNTTVDNLLNYNNLSTTSLSIGQQILIPTELVVPPVEQPGLETLIYRVQKGDNLYAIARNFDTTINELIAINNLKSTSLSIGQEIMIPIKPIEPELPTISQIEYIVKKGDNLYAIANKYNTTSGEIITLNNLKSTSLSIGQILKIPTKEAQITYVVKSGDNLYAIANKFNTTVNSIKMKNNLKTNNLSIGQILII